MSTRLQSRRMRSAPPTSVAMGMRRTGTQTRECGHFPVNCPLQEEVEEELWPECPALRLVPGGDYPLLPPPLPEGEELLPPTQGVGTPTSATEGEPHLSPVTEGELHQFPTTEGEPHQFPVIEGDYLLLSPSPPGGDYLLLLPPPLEGD
ncbi:UNVERIFIED_CONTAM: hypothetical protein FKN15_054218 [Acipenser sinensis]